MYTQEELNSLKTKTMIIYKITNLINNKIYIGQTVNSFNRRYCGGGVGAERVLKTKKSNKYLLSSIKKYGASNFKVEIIEQCNTIEELNKQEAYYISLYESSSKEKGYNRLSGGENQQWNWERILESYIFNREKLNSEISAIKRLHKKTKIRYDSIVRDIHKKPIFVKSRKTGKITKYNNILTYCYRDKNGQPNTNSTTNNKSSLSPTSILICCKQQSNHEVYNRVFKQKTNQTNDFFYCEGNKEIEAEYEAQQKQKMEKLYNKRKNSVVSGVRAKNKEISICPLCGAKRKSSSKYCADCKRKKHEEKLNEGKTSKKCIICNKEHYRIFDTCSSRCTNKHRNIRKKLNSYEIE